MLRRLLWGMLLTLAAASCSENTISPAGSRVISQVESIQVDFHHSGWGRFEEEFTIYPRSGAGDFVLHSSYFDADDELHRTEQKASAGAIQVLLAAAAAPAWHRSAGVRAVAATVRPSRIELKPFSQSPPHPCTNRELARMTRRYLAREGMVALVDEHYGQGLSWTDDYPGARLQIRFRNGQTLRLFSDSQKAMMLPWYSGIPVVSPLDSEQNWSLPLSLALQGVLPQQSRLYERLGGGGLPERLSWKVYRKVDKECRSSRSSQSGSRAGIRDSSGRQGALSTAYAEQGVMLVLPLTA